MARQTFAQIAARTRELPFGHIGDLNDHIKWMVDFADLNARETIHVDKAATEDQFDAIALASLESNLCYCEDHDVCAWFVKNGVAF
jgi:hypothetical protein